MLLQKAAAADSAGTIHLTELQTSLILVHHEKTIFLLPTSYAVKTA